MAWRALTKSAAAGAAEHRPGLRRRGLRRLAAVGVATIGALALAMATPAAAFAAVPPTPLPTPVLFEHTNLKDCDQIAPPGDDELLTSGGGPNSASNANGTGTLSGDGKSLDVTILDGHSVTAIIVKGGDDANVYFFDPAVPGEATFEDLVAPLNASGGPAGISHWLVCGIDEGDEPEVGAVVTSEVHLDGTHAAIDNANPATAPADVHDSVVVTVSGLDEWVGDVIMSFYTNGDCAGNAADTTAQGDIPVNQGTAMPLEDLLPQSGLAAGDYSYKAVFVTGNPALPAVTEGACEPFKVVDPRTTPPSSTSSLPQTGNTVGDVGLGTLAVAGAVLVAGGAALILFRRRRNVSEG
jgi:hypothetical protein